MYTCFFLLLKIGKHSNNNFNNLTRLYLHTLYSISFFILDLILTLCVTNKSHKHYNFHYIHE